MTLAVPVASVAPRRLQRAALAVFAALCYVPLLLTDPGKVHADTKSYLYLDPTRLLAGARSMWDPEIGLGTTSHQTIGYLFPLGPYYWFTIDVLGIPAWIAQRLALGTMLFAAGLGLRALLRIVGVRGPGVAVGVVAYTFTPYVLQYSARLSVLLGPWAALPWLTGFTILALRAKPSGLAAWRYPALIAITVQLVGSVNLTALVLAVLGPTLWAPYAVWVLGEVSWRRVWSSVWRIALLTLLASSWWMSGLWVEGRYGLNILRFTESIQTVSATSYPYEIVRGLGYWFFYGRDRIGHWNDAYLVYSLNVAVVFASLAIPAIALLSSAVIRWRARGYFALLVVLGVAIAVGAAPYEDPSPLGSIYKSFATTSTIGFALRSVARAAPLMVLGLSALLAAGVSAFVAAQRDRGRPRLALATPIVIVGLCLLNAPGVWDGRYYSDYLARDESIPDYWSEVLADLDAADDSTRVLALPGADFAAYRWGDTIDPIEPGLIDRPYVARELVPWGSEPTTNLLVALDRRLQEGTLDPDAVAPIARLMGVGDVLLRFDLETDRFTIIPAGPLWQTFTDANADTGVPIGLTPPTTYGEEIPGELLFPELGDLARPPSQDPDPPPVAVMSVADPVDIVRTKPVAAIVVAGDGDGLVDLAAGGLLDGNAAVLYSGTFAATPDSLADLPEGSVLVVTDSNRRRGMRWAGLYTNYGYTELSGEEPLLEDLLDQRLVVFPDAGDDAFTVTELDGVADIRATRYGSASFGYTPGERPAMMFDGDRETAWVVDGGSTLSHQRAEITFDEPITTDSLTIVQPRTQRSNQRSLARISLRFDGGAPEYFDLGRASRRRQGQVIEFGARTFSELEVRMEDTRGAEGLFLGNLNPVGIAELRIHDRDDEDPIRIVESARLPTDLLDAVGTSDIRHPLAVVVSRDLTMDGTAMNRRFELPSSRSFSVTGTLNLSSFAEDDVIDALFGFPGADAGGVTATSTGRLGDPIARASSAIDGDPATAWITPIAFVKDSRLDLEFDAARTIDHLELEFMADGRHSMPTQLSVTGDDGIARIVELPEFDRSTKSGRVSASVDIDELTTTTLEVEISGFAPVERSETVMPVGVVELGIEGVAVPAVPDRIDSGCRTGLLEIDGRPIAVRVDASTADVLRQRRLPFEVCGGPVSLAAGSHTLRAPMNPDARTGFDLAQVALVSSAGGRAGTLDDVTMSGVAERVDMIEDGRSRVEFEVAASSQARWLVLGQSLNDGWHATVNGEDLGAPTLIDGYANGWRLEPAADDLESNSSLRVVIEWRPQRVVDASLWVSLVAVTAAMAIVVLSSVRLRRHRRIAGARPATDAPLARDAIAVLPEPEFIGLAREPMTTGRVAAAVVVVLVGGLAGLLVAPVVGFVVAAVLVGARLRPLLRSVAVALPPIVVFGVGVFMAASQLVRDLPPRFDWPSQFEVLRIPTWIALFVFVGEAVLSMVADRVSPVEIDPPAGGHVGS
jgi:arabinofuranan 3-O-arabinosyltransferase